MKTMDKKEAIELYETLVQDFLNKLEKEGFFIGYPILDRENDISSVALFYKDKNNKNNTTKLPLQVPAKLAIGIAYYDPKDWEARMYLGTLYNNRSTDEVVFQRKDEKWDFYLENHLNKCGPFETKKEAEQACIAYAKKIFYKEIL